MFKSSTWDEGGSNKGILSSPFLTLGYQEMCRLSMLKGGRGSAGSGGDSGSGGGTPFTVVSPSLTGASAYMCDL